MLIENHSTPINIQGREDILASVGHWTKCGRVIQEWCGVLKNPRTGMALEELCDEDNWFIDYMSNIAQRIGQTPPSPKALLDIFTSNRADLRAARKNTSFDLACRLGAKLLLHHRYHE